MPPSHAIPDAILHALPDDWDERAAYLRAHPQITDQTYPWTGAELAGALAVARHFGRPIGAVLSSWFADMRAPWPTPPE